MWKIYINYGTSKEFETINGLTFKTKKEASAWAKEHKYPLKCVMRENEWEEYKGLNSDIVVCK